MRGVHVLLIALVASTALAGCLSDAPPTATDPAPPAPQEGQAESTQGDNRTGVLEVVAHETASASADGDEPDMPNPLGGEIVTTRAYVLGELHNPGGTNFLGFGAAYGQKFQIHMTVFYGEPTPEGFSRIPS